MQTVEIMEKTFEAESGDIALYLAMSKKAAEFAILLGKVKDTRSNLAMMLEGEIKSEQDKAQAKEVALAEGHHEASQLFEKTMQDERRHKAEIKAVLSKLQEKD